MLFIQKIHMEWQHIWVSTEIDLVCVVDLQQWNSKDKGHQIASKEMLANTSLCYFAIYWPDEKLQNLKQTFP